MSPQRKDHVWPQCKGALCTPWTEASGETEPAHTLMVDLQSPKLGDINGEENKRKRNETKTDPSYVWPTEAPPRIQSTALLTGLLTDVLLGNEG